MTRTGWNLGNPHRCTGLTLVESVIAMLVISVGLVAAINAVGSARQGESRLSDARRADELARSLISEIEAQAFSDPSDSNASVGPTPTELAGVSRALFNDVNDYMNFTESPPRTKDGSSLGLDFSWRRRAEVRLMRSTLAAGSGTLSDGLAAVTVIVSRNNTDIATVTTMVSAGLPATESCVLPGGACENLVPAHCAALGGASGGAGSNCWTMAELDKNESSPARVFYTRTAIKDVQTSTFDDQTSTWSTTGLSGTTAEHGPQGVRAARVGSSIAVVATRWDEQIYAAVCDANGAGTYSQISADSDCGLGDRRPFDVASEGSSDDVLIVYWDAPSSKLMSRTVVGGAISAPVATGMGSPAVRFVTLVPMGETSDQIMAIVINTSNHLLAALWNGGAWGAATTLSTSLNSASQEGACAALMQSSGSLMVAFSNTTDTRFAYRVYVPGSGWSAVAYRTGLSDAPVWFRALAVPGTDTIHLAMSDDDGGYRTSLWNGSTWSSPTTISGSAGTSYRGFDITSTRDGSTIMFIYRTNNTTLTHRTWTGAAWSNASTAFTHTNGSVRTILARPGPTDKSILGVFGDSSAGTNVWSWNAGTFGARSRLGVTDGYMSDKERFVIVGSEP